METMPDKNKIHYIPVGAGIGAGSGLVANWLRARIAGKAGSWKSYLAAMAGGGLLGAGVGAAIGPIQKRYAEESRRTGPPGIDPETGEVIGYDPRTGFLDMKKNLEDTYGSNTDVELNKADAYAESAGLPFRMGQGYKNPIRLDFSSEPMYNQHFIAPESMHLGEFTSIPDMTEHMRDSAGLRYEGNTPEAVKQSFKDLGGKSSLRHEMSHAASMRNKHTGGKNGPLSGMIKYKTMAWDLKTPYIRSKLTYPDMSPLEAIPPLAAIQQHLYETTGRRIEHQGEYDAYVKKLDAVPEQDRLKVYSKLPKEIRRFLSYRDTMRKDKKNPERLKNYDRFNRMYIPGVVDAGSTYRFDKSAYIEGYLCKEAARSDLPLRERVEVIATKGDKILMQKRKGYVEMPGGGIDPGESLKQTVKRETMEEAGASLKNIKPAGVVEAKWYPGIKKTDWGKELWDNYRGSRTHFYTAEVSGNLKSPTSDEGDGWSGPRFLSIDKAKKIMNQFDNSYGMKDYRDKQKDLVGSAVTEKEAAKKQEPWIAVDLDGTLAKYTKFKSDTHIGDPIPKMVLRVKRWLRQGKKVKIFTARAHKMRWQAKKAIEDWCVKYIGRKLEITNEKDPMMYRLWDDRAMDVKRNDGTQTRFVITGKQR